jgi:hypothetical protein
MTSESTTRAHWPVLNESAPFAHAPTARTGRRKLPRSAWLLTGLAFICGGLVSAAGFSIGWRHQAQRDTQARTALAAATSHADRLSASLATTRQALASERRAATRASASARAASHAATTLAADAAAAGRAAQPVSGSAGDIATTSLRVSSELETLLTYLTTTPSGQIDSGYVASQATYLTRQMSTLQDAGGSIAKDVMKFDAAVRKLTLRAVKVKSR